MNEPAKLHLVSIVLHGRLYSAFIYMKGTKIAMKTYLQVFPVLAGLPRGSTFTIG